MINKQNLYVRSLNKMINSHLRYHNFGFLFIRKVLKHQRMALKKITRKGILNCKLNQFLLVIIIINSIKIITCQYKNKKKFILTKFKNNLSLLTKKNTLFHKDEILRFLHKAKFLIQQHRLV
jgi:hypothetical protein